LDPVREKVTHKNVKKKRIREEIFNRGKINGLKLKRQHKPGLAFPKTFGLVGFKKSLSSLTAGYFAQCFSRIWLALLPRKGKRGRCSL
jgi:hypothetical protein